jgi:tRNA A37 threonylcarbamoyladenosine dehydratase
MIGDDINKLHNSNVIIFGLGGVGGYVAEMLVRSGVGNVTIVDYDVIDVTNKNRQIIALDSTIGKYKVDVWADRLKDINSKCNISPIKEKLTKDNLGNFNLNQYDYIIDAIDMVTSKIALIDFAYKNNLNIISAMGTGKRMGMPHFEVKDLFETTDDKFAKVLRHELRKLNVEKHKVVCTMNKAIDCGETIGSVVYHPAMCGCVLSAYVIEEIIRS